MCGGRVYANKTLSQLYSHVKYGDANYDKKEDCDWLIMADNDRKVHLEFLTFEVEYETNCAYDYVELFDGYDDSAPSLGKFCGNKVSGRRGRVCVCVCVCTDSERDRQ